MTHFCDEVTITVKGGDGGNGAVSFRHETYIPLGGPSGGDGGRGGNIIFRANPNINTLIDYVSCKSFSGGKGGHGSNKDMHGSNGEDVYLDVPVGTLIHHAETKELLADLSHIDDTYLASAGGRGGKGNAHFVSSIRQAPRFAETGEKVKPVPIHLELSLVADVGFIGFPSVGKSTLISVVSAAKPKIADYDFTTLIPNLGVVKVADKASFVVCDIPGLIEGASEGKGLGHQFLRHIKRCRLLVHIIDPWRGDPVENWKIINKELKKFDKELAKRPQFTVVNKIDTLPEEDLDILLADLKKAGAKNLRAISAVAHTGTDKLMAELYRKLEKIPREIIAESNPTAALPIIRPQADSARDYRILKEADGRLRVVGARLEQIVSMTPLDNPEGYARVLDVIHKIGLARELKKAGAKPGDTIRIAEKEFEFILWD